MAAVKERALDMIQAEGNEQEERRNRRERVEGRVREVGGRESRGRGYCD